MINYELSFGLDVQNVYPDDELEPVEVPDFAAGSLGEEPVTVELKVTVAEDAQVGRHQRPFLRLYVHTEGGAVHHVLGAGELRIDRPLSPELKARLEAGKKKGDGGSPEDGA